MAENKKGRYSDDIEQVSVRTMAMFYLFDCSGSMAGTKIGQVNYAMKDIPKIIKDISDNAPNADIKVAAAAFANDVNWITPEPQTPDDFINTWKDMKADGLTSLGAALRSLNEKMSRSAFLAENPMGYLAPGIVILSDGEPTDDWARPLEELKRNNWFKSAIKIAFAVGDDANRQVLAEITGSDESVIPIDDPEKIRGYIKLVTALISKTGTTNQNTSGDSAQDAVNKQIKDAEDNDKPFVVDIPDIDDKRW